MSVHGDLIEHMDLARRFLGPKASEARLLRVMERHTPDELRRKLDEQSALRAQFDAVLRELGVIPSESTRRVLARLASTFRLAEPNEVWRCGVVADRSQDCDWPFCGCDPHATRVIEELQECGLLGVR